jgi:hypothetical protein
MNNYIQTEKQGYDGSDLRLGGIHGNDVQYLTKAGNKSLTQNVIYSQASVYEGQSLILLIL